MSRKLKSGRRSIPASTARGGLPLQVRVAAFLVLALVVALAAFVVWPRTPTASAAQRVQIDMSGFQPAVISASAGEPIRLQLVNPDSQFHSDGGGWHELNIPDLGIDARVARRSDRTMDIPAAQPGDYPFYCDICCGGKDNPSMQGVLKITA